MMRAAAGSQREKHLDSGGVAVLTRILHEYVEAKLTEKCYKIAQHDSATADSISFYRSAVQTGFNFCSSGELYSPIFCIIK